MNYLHRFGRHAGWLIAIVIALGGGLAQARPMASAAVSATVSADALIHLADGVAQNIDAGRYDAVWQRMASFVQDELTRAQFAAATRARRQAWGAVSQRQWSAVTLIAMHGAKNAPDGRYANVDYVTTLTSGQVVHEQLSFYLQPDGRWHLTGYVPRGAEPTAPTGR